MAKLKKGITARIGRKYGVRENRFTRVEFVQGGRVIRSIDVKTRTAASWGEETRAKIIKAAATDHLFHNRKGTPSVA